MSIDILKRIQQSPVNEYAKLVEFSSNLRNQDSEYEFYRQDSPFLYESATRVYQVLRSLLRQQQCRHISSIMVGPR